MKSFKTAKVAKRIGATNFVECSAKTQENLQRVFEFAAMAGLEWKRKKETGLIGGGKRDCTII